MAVPGNLIIFSILFACVITTGECAMTQKQIAAAQRLTRNMCQPKHKVTDDQIQEMKNGNFDDTKPLKCYIDCIFQMFKVTKNGVFDMEAMKVQLEQIPEPLKTALEASAANCQDKANGPDKCDGAYNMAKCMYAFDKDSYLVP
uniref:Odorant-binding protein 10 n=1 Tax=Rhyzopertha dominica TaxID=92692 RepID=A0A0X8SYK0_RHYDO|nr:odorant-binding protein 10 [Rhyzopertha dominica]